CILDTRYPSPNLSTRVAHNGQQLIKPCSREALHAPTCSRRACPLRDNEMSSHSTVWPGLTLAVSGWRATGAVCSLVGTIRGSGAAPCSGECVDTCRLQGCGGGHRKRGD